MHNYNTSVLSSVTAATVTTAAFAKTFAPFYLIGSTPIFVAVSALGAILVVLNWRRLYDAANRVADILVILAAFYGLVIVNFLIQSSASVPKTHLIGILLFHALFIVFGVAAALAVKAVLIVLLSAAGIYTIAIIQYVARFGNLMKDSYLHDIFGVGDPAVFITFHQNIGIVLGLAALAALGFASNRVKKILAFGALPLVLLFLFHIGARGALVALVLSLAFLAGAAFWVRSRKLALFSVTAIIVAATLSAGLFYKYALHVQDWDRNGTDAISRTIREIQRPNPGLRFGIWTTTWQRVSSEPDRLLFGQGIGMYPVIEGFGAPDWLLRRTEGAKHYPHNVYLELLYETGLAGLLLFSILTLSPLAIVLRRWHLLSLPQRSAVSMYVFQFVSSLFSGAFAFGYPFQFFFAIVVGIIALSRADHVLVPGNHVPRATG